MRHKSFAAFILTHGRADRVYTYKTMRKHGYTGRIVIVIDNEDKQADDYLKMYGDEVYIFDKAEAYKYTDVGDNRGDAQGVVFARNACWNIARDLGVEYFIVLDDDYSNFNHRWGEDGEYCFSNVRDLDAVLDAMLDYYISTPALTIAMAQGGDFAGGANGSAPGYWRKLRRKAMNSFICSVHRPFKFFGRINEDVNAYTANGARGGLFITVGGVALQQKQTQTNPGGLTDIYLDSGTYVKSFYSVMYQPSSIKISVLGSNHSRIHHKVHWRYTVPCIVSESARKP